MPKIKLLRLFAISDAPEQRFFVLALPIGVITLGTALFWTQILFRWWTPDTLRHVLLQIVGTMSLGAILIPAVVILANFVQSFWKSEQDTLYRIVLAALLVYLGVAAFFALKPAHLTQEYDFLNYHLFLPKQSWLKSSWVGLERSFFEYLHMGPQLGLSFLWIGLGLFNKLPQFALTLYLILILLHFWPQKRVGILVATLFLGFRGVTLQVATAMMDLPTIYILAICALGLTLRKHSVKSAAILGLSVAAYLGHKSYGVFLFLVFFGTCAVLFRSQLKWTPPKSSAVVAFTLTLTALWLPNPVKSAWYTGDPFYPVLPKLSAVACSGAHLNHIKCPEIFDRALKYQNLRVVYGYGHSLKSLFKSLWLVAIPRAGTVNNAYDYPLGLSWYFCWAMLILAILNRRFQKYRQQAINAFVLASIMFLVWFAGSQQSRWLYPTILSLSVGVGWIAAQEKKKWFSIATICFAFLAITTNTVRIIRAQGPTSTCWGMACLNDTQREDYTSDCKKLKTDSIDGRGYASCRFNEYE